MKGSVLIFVSLMLLVYSVSFAQGTRLFTAADGLPSSQIISLVNDVDGYMWITTYGGLARFDGSGITTFYESRGIKSLRSNTVNCFFTDPSGQNWLGTTRGLQLFHPKTEIFEHVRLEKGEDDNTTRNGLSISIADIKLLPDGKSIILCAGMFGYYVVDLSTHKIRQKETALIRNILKNHVGRVLFVDSKNRLWVASDELFLIDLTTYKTIPISINMKPNLQASEMEITDFVEEKRTGTILIADKWNGVLVFDESHKEIHKLSLKPTQFYSAQCLLQRMDGTLLVGCENNRIGKIDLLQRSISEYKLMDSPLDLSHSKVHEMTEDKWGNLYVGIFQKGMLIVPTSTGGFFYQAISESLHTQNQAAVTSILSLADHRILIGTDGGGVFVGKNIETLNKGMFPSLNNASVQNIVLGAGKIWFATYGSGLFNYDKGSIKAIPNKGDIINKNVRYLQFDSIHQVLYIGNIGSGLNQLDVKTGALRKIPFGSKWIFALKLDSKGRLWIGDLNCLCYDPISKKTMSFNLAVLDNSTVNTFLEYNNLMYIGTNIGLFVFDEKSNTCRHYPLDFTNKTISVKAIASSLDGRIWMSTNRGIVRLNTETGDSRFFSSYDIRKVGDFHSNAVFSEGDGSLVFGGDNGIVSIKPSALDHIKSESNPLHFSALTVNGEKISYDPKNKSNMLDAAIGYASSIKLYHHQNSFTLRFSALNYANTSQLRYSYQLEGYESIWHSTTNDNPLAVYNQLPPGIYKIVVQSMNEEKASSNTEISIVVHIMAPWYWAWWSKIVYLLVLLSVLYSQYRMSQNRQRSKKRQRTVMSEFLRIKEHYQKLIPIQATEEGLSSNSTDEKLKQKIGMLITKHLSESSFGVEELSNELGLSRVHLYRRTKELFDCSPNDLIKSIRLKKAGLMLIQGKSSIAEVAYEVGYAEPSYFSKSFKSYFNMSPKEFVARYRENADEETLKQLFEI